MTLCLIREELARTCPPAEELFAIQGLGSYPILLAGTESQKRRWLPSLARGESVPAFALTEPDAGSDAAALSTRAESDGDHWLLTRHEAVHLECAGRPPLRRVRPHRIPGAAREVYRLSWSRGTLPG